MRTYTHEHTQFCIFSALQYNAFNVNKCNSSVLHAQVVFKFDFKLLNF